MLEQVAFPTMTERDATPEELPDGFLTHPVHEVLHRLSEMRPPVDIAVK